MPITPLKLPAALEEFVASQVRNGAYRSREAAIVAAVLHQRRAANSLPGCGRRSRRASTPHRPVNLISTWLSGEAAVGWPLTPAGREANAASDRALSRSACRL
jgi:hypothetical protein